MFKKIAKNTFMLRTDERTCSTVYLIEENGKKLLIDSGDGGVKIDFVPDICILTHGHYDHTLGVKKDWPKVLLHKDEFSFKGAYIKIPENAAANPMKNLEFGPHEFEFFHTPGHTDGSVSIFDLKTGLLFSGDTKFAGGSYGITNLGGSKEKMLQSLKLIDSLGYKLLCPGHGELEERKP